MNIAQTILKPLASLRLTAVLLLLASVLIFAGTWAQIDADILHVQQKYFHSWFCWISMGLFLPRGPVDHPFWGKVVATLKPLGFPMVGGYTLILAMLANLLTAHGVRFKARW